jgi:hypothetical protein
MQTRRNRQQDAARVGALVAGCTAVLTASFLGLASLLTGPPPGLAGRIPFYVLAMAVAFVASVVGFEERLHSTKAAATIRAAAAVAAASLLVVTLASEGLVHAVQHPGEVVASQLLVYFLAAGLVGTGLSYWGVNHWRELARQVSVGPGWR